MNDVFAQPEGATDLTPEEREGLKQTWITTRGDLDEAEQANIDEAVAWTTKIGNRNLLTEDFVFELHERMLADVWEWAGKTRTTNKNIGVDKTQIRVRLGGLLRDARYWIENSIYPADEIAVRLHHGLVFIHPFPNGNGRHANSWLICLLRSSVGSLSAGAVRHCRKLGSFVMSISKTFERLTITISGLSLSSLGAEMLPEGV